MTVLLRRKTGDVVSNANPFTELARSRAHLSWGLGTVSAAYVTGDAWPLVVLPLGIVACGAAHGLADGLREGLSEWVLQRIGVDDPPPTTATPGDGRDRTFCSILSRMPGSVFNEIAAIAADQHGYVTTADARDHGIAPINLSRMAQREILERRATGVYRLRLTPVGPRDAYMEATLWPQRGVRGVLSQETALALYEMSDVNPASIHIAVPVAHRVRRAVPRIYRLHHEDLDPTDVTAFDGIPIVTPAHAVRQAATAGLGDALVGQAIDHGEQSGRLSRKVATALRAELALRRGTGMRR
jgi:hypothetical protein